MVDHPFHICLILTYMCVIAHFELFYPKHPMARIQEEEIERIKRETDLASLVRGSGVELVAVGRELRGRCPFHDDKTPSLYVNSEKRVWNCRGACDAGGDAIAWVMRRDGVDFRRAAEILGRRQAPGIRRAAEREEPARGEPAAKDDSPGPSLSATDPEVQNLLRWLVEYHHQALFRSKRALEYLESRGIRDREILRRFRVGFADRTLVRKLPPRDSENGRRMRELLRGLGLLNRQGQERLHGSLCFPAFDAAGNVAQMTFRRAKGDLAREAMRHGVLSLPLGGMFGREALEREEIVVCESPLDMMSFYSLGFKNALSLFGCNGPADELVTEVERRAISRVYLAQDRDAAGDRGAEKLAERLAGSGAEVLRINFAPGTDANDLLRKSENPKEEFRELVRGAVWISGSGGPRAKTQLPGDDMNAKGEDANEKTNAADVPGVDFDSFVRKIDIPARTSADGNVIELVCGDRYYRVEGFRRNSSPGSLQVSLTGVCGERTFADKLELYSARDRGRFVAGAAAEFEEEPSAVKSDLDRVFRKLRELQEDMIRERLEGAEKKTYVMGPAEEREAREWLKKPDPLGRAARDIELAGVVGEETNVRVAYLAAISRLLEDPLGVLFQSPSAAGKSTLMNAILGTIPEEEKLFFTDMSPQALYYMEDEDALSHKTVAFAEESGMESVEYALKTLISDKVLSKAATIKDPETGNLVTRSFVRRGPAQLFLTTNRPHVTEDVLNRLLLLVLNDDRELTRRIHELQRRARTREGLDMRARREKVCALHQNVQRLIRPLRVVNPFAHLLTFPSERNRTRRDHERYLTLLDSLALLEQHRRPVFREVVGGAEVDCVAVTKEDVRSINPLAREIFGSSLDELGPVTRRLLLSIARMVSERCERKGLERADCLFSRRDVREHSGWSPDQVRDHLERLAQFEYVVPVRGRQGVGFLYRLEYEGSGEEGERIFSGLIDPDSLPDSPRKRGRKAPVLN